MDYRLYKTTRFAKFVMALGIQPTEETEEALFFKSKKMMHKLVSERFRELCRTEEGRMHFVNSSLSAGYSKEELYSYVEFEGAKLDDEIAKLDARIKELRKQLVANTAKLKGYKNGDCVKKTSYLETKEGEGQFHNQKGEHEKSEVGKACWDGTIGDLLTLDRGEFKKIFKENFNKYVRKEMSYKEARSWWDCFRTLKWQVFNTFDKADLAVWEKLRIVFEMVLPNQQRTDVLIFTPTMIIVLEFKRYKEEYFGHFREVKAYCDKIEQWTDVCNGRKVRGIVVYTRMEKREVHQWKRMRMCSSAQLKEQLLHLQQNLKLSQGATTNSFIKPEPKPVPVEPSKDLPYDYGTYCEAIGNYEEAYTYYRKAARNREKIAIERLDRASFNRRDPLHKYAKYGWC